MKTKFPGHFANTLADQELWDHSIFVFDTNILLNLYRYSDETRALFLKTLNLLRDRVWIPYRVAEEYFGNRLTVIYEQQEEYEKAVSDIQKIKAKLESSRQHPFVSSETMKEVAASLEKTIVELNQNKATHNKRISADEIKDEISEIFDGRVGDSLDDSELEKIILEGVTRYEQKIPPGYSDIKKQGGDSSLASRSRPYGDLIIWKCIIEKSKQENSPIIFVTDDGKEDWWLRFKGKTLGPRPELIKEFKEETNQLFHMYLPERFLTLASEKAQEKPSEEMLEEIRDVRKKESYLDEENGLRRPVGDTPFNKMLRMPAHHVMTSRYMEDSLVTPWHEQEMSYRAEVEELNMQLDELKQQRDKLRSVASSFAQLRSLGIDTPDDEKEHQKYREALEHLTGQIHKLNFKRDYLIDSANQLRHLGAGFAEWTDE
ncbi:PIN domain-containing protein [Stutzerimonas kunmingensis]|uniref:PIN domain-containing protein n=1 Tax=Stutzerimonas kunmingensis TaxID=1211807 RepID=UPI00241D2E66|nr:PIN domain-containing protein [Stutzerimonas kunmingensis]